MYWWKFEENKRAKIVRVEPAMGTGVTKKIELSSAVSHRSYISYIAVVVVVVVVLTLTL